MCCAICVLLSMYVGFQQFLLNYYKYCLILAFFSYYTIEWVPKSNTAIQWGDNFSVSSGISGMEERLVETKLPSFTKLPIVSTSGLLSVSNVFFFFRPCTLQPVCTHLGLTIFSFVFQYSAVFSDYKPKSVLISCSYSSFHHGLSNPVCIALSFRLDCVFQGFSLYHHFLAGPCAILLVLIIKISFH